MSTIAEILQKMLPRFRAVAPAGTPVEDIVENVIYAVSHDPDLGKSSANSILDAVLEALSLGLDPSGLARDGCMIPRKTKSGGFRAVFVPDYRAIIRTILSNERISHVEAHVVWKGDHFQLRFGDPTGRVVDHQPDVVSDNREPIGAYAIAWFKDSERPLVEWMTKGEIDANAERGGSYGSDNSPWETDWPEMARKTVIKRLAKYLPQYHRKTSTLAVAHHENYSPDKSVSDLARQYRVSIETTPPDGLDAVIKAIREDDALDYHEKTELFNLACARKKELSRKA